MPLTIGQCLLTVNYSCDESELQRGQEVYIWCDCDDQIHVAAINV